ncbi:MAG: carboxypeptidase-like regulatory domain-containing protein [Ignavibacteriales bacterium]
MTLEIKKLHERILISFLILIIGCLAISTAILISMIFGPTMFTLPNFSSGDERLTSMPNIDLGKVSGIVMGSDDLPVSGVSVHVYKHMGVISSADKKAGYSASTMTESDGSYALDNLPSGVYKFTISYPDGTIQTIDNYAVWPSSSSSYIFEED